MRIVLTNEKEVLSIKALEPKNETTLQGITYGGEKIEVRLTDILYIDNLQKA